MTRLGGIKNPPTGFREYWTQVTGGSEGTVLVPLCGKSLDMIWLAQQGHRVIGVELSDVAVESFFSENGLEAQWQERWFSVDASALIPFTAVIF